MSNLSEFLSENSFSIEQVADRSTALETLTTADRDRRVARETARREKKKYDEAGAEKPARYGRGVSVRTMKLAADGQPVTRLSRKKITRAVNSLLESAKKEPVEWRVLFADVGSRKGKK